MLLWLILIPYREPPNDSPKHFPTIAECRVQYTAALHYREMIQNLAGDSRYAEYVEDVWWAAWSYTWYVRELRSANGPIAYEDFSKSEKHWRDKLINLIGKEQFDSGSLPWRIK